MYLEFDDFDTDSILIRPTTHFWIMR